MIGNDPNRAATASRSEARLRSCHSGARAPGRRRGSSKRAAGRFAEPRREHRRRSELPHDEPLDFIGIGQQQRRVRQALAIRIPDHEPIVRPHHLDVDAGLIADARGGRHRPGRVDAAAERRQHRDAPVAEIVARALDHDRAIVGDGAGRGVLLVEIRRAGWRPPSHRGRDRAASVGERRRGFFLAQLANQLADRHAELDGPARALRPSRTASCPARPARATPARDRA